MKRLSQWYAALIASIGGGITGINLVWTASTQLPLTTGQYHDFTVTDNQFSWISGNLALGGLLASFVTGYFCDRWGRKMTIIVAALPCILAAGLMMTAVNAEMIQVSRFFMGLGIGVYSSSCPLYINEISEDSIRGALGSLYVNQLIIWSIISYFVGITWDIFYYGLFCGLVPLAASILMFLVPETPFFYALKEDFESSERSLRLLRGPTDFTIDLDFLKHSIERKGGKCFTDVALNTQARKAILIGGMLMALSHLTGAEVVVFFTEQIFREAGVTLESKYCVFTVRIVSLIGDFSATFLADRWGRKALLIPSCLVTCLSMAVLGVYFSVKIQAPSSLMVGGDVFKVIPLVALSVFSFVYSAGLGPLPFVITPELSPRRFKSGVCSVVLSWNWLLTFATTTSFLPFMNAAGQDVVFYCFSAMALIGSVAVKYLVPETTGSLEDDDQTRQLSGDNETNVMTLQGV